MTRTAAAVKARAARVLKTVESIGADPYDEGIFMLVECGLHSGFPICCIEFFVRGYWPLMEHMSSLNAHGESVRELLDRASLQQATALRAMERYRDAVRRSDVTPGYIPCPRCLKSRRTVRVRCCDWHLTARERHQALRSHEIRQR
jgi:hypothetical protein